MPTKPGPVSARFHTLRYLPSLTTLLLAGLLCLGQVALLTACGGCSARHDEAGGSSAGASAGANGRTSTGPAGSGAHIVRAVEENGTDSSVPVRPNETILSEAAEISAAYLILMQALTGGDEEAAVAAADILAKGRGEWAMPTGQWIEAGIWFMERKSVNAIPFLRSAVSCQPDNVHLNLLYAEALSDHNFNDEAMAVLDGYLQRFPEDPEALMQKGILYFKQKKAREAIATFEGIRRFERSGFVEYYHARALANLGEDEEALKHVRLAVKQLPDFADALSLQAFLCERTGELREARSTYEKLLEGPVPPKDVLLRLVNISLKLNQPTRALSYYEKGPKDDPGFQLLAASLFTEARHYLQAERILKEMTARPRVPGEVYLFLAELTYEQRRDLPAALAWLDRLATNGEFGQKKLLTRAQLQAQAKEWDQALETVRLAEENFPAAPDFVALEARILAGMGKRDDAVQRAREGVAAHPESTELAFLLGSLLAEDGQHEEAFSIMEGIIEKDNSNFLALNYVGYTLADSNTDVKRAITLLERANALAPEQYFILDSLAWAHFRAGDLELAWKLINDAVRLDSSDDAEIWEHYGDIALARGQKGEARNAYRKALKTADVKGDEKADNIRTKLNALNPQ